MGKASEKNARPALCSLSRSAGAVDGIEHDVAADGLPTWTVGGGRGHGRGRDRAEALGLLAGDETPLEQGAALEHFEVQLAVLLTLGPGLVELDAQLLSSLTRASRSMRASCCTPPS